MDDHRRGLSASIGPGPITLGLTYTACSFVAVSQPITFNQFDNFFQVCNLKKKKKEKRKVEARERTKKLVKKPRIVITFKLATLQPIPPFFMYPIHCNFWSEGGSVGCQRQFFVCVCVGYTWTVIPESACQKIRTPFGYIPLVSLIWSHVVCLEGGEEKKKLV